jgi:hypothetical protein
MALLGGLPGGRQRLVQGAALGLALTFALASAWASGAGYTFVTKPREAELTALRSRARFAELVEHRIAKMTRTERRQFDALMKWGDGQ